MPTSFLRRWYRLLRKSLREPGKPASRKRTPLCVEGLESRVTPSITLTGAPGWLSVGPEPITFANNVELNVGGNGITAEDVQVGAVNSIAVAPNQQTVYLGTVNGGVWKTNDITNLAANPWVPLTDSLPSLSVRAVAISPADPNTVFAGVGRFSSAGGDGGPRIGLLRSQDGGATWTVLGASQYAGTSIRSVVPTAIATPSGHVVLVSTAGGLVFRSVADGDAPAQLSGQPAAFDGVDNNNNGVVDEPGEKNLPSSANDSSLIASPVANQFYLGLGGQGVFRSDDGGVTWRRMDNNGATSIANVVNSGRIVLTAPAGNTVYAGVIVNGALDGVWRSDDNGGSWRKIANQLPGYVFQPTDPQGNTHFSILADPAKPDVFYIAGDTIPGGLPSDILDGQVTGRNPANVYRVDTTNGMDVWEKIVADGAVGTSPHPGSRVMAFLGDVILEADDGGVYALRFPDGPANVRRWESRLGNLRDTEANNAAFDVNRNTYLAGAQDNAAFEQQAPGDPPWRATVGGGDGIVQVQTSNLGANETSLHYSSSQFLGGFKREIFNGNNPVQVELVKLKVTGSSGNLDLEQVEASSAGGSSVQAVTPYVLNAVDQNRMLIGTHYLYESTNPDRGDTLTAVGGLDASNTKPNPAGNLGSAVTALAYGGRTGGAPNAQLMYAGTQDVFDGNGNLIVAGQVFIRTSGSGMPTASAAYKAAGGAGVRDLVIDPDDGATAYVLDRTGRVWQTTNAGGSWTEITFNLPGLSSDLRTIELFDQDPGGGNSPKVLLVGGLGGVFRMLPPPPDCPTMRWTEYGADLPHALVTDFHYYGGAADRLVAATFGRGVWTIPSVSTSITTLGTLQVTGDGGPNAMELRQDPSNPSRIVVSDGLGNTQSFDAGLFSAVAFQGLGGDDTIRIDSNGAAAVGGDIKFVTFHVDVDGGGQPGDSLFVEDFDNFVTDQVTVTATSAGDGVGDSFFGDCGELTYAGLANLTLDLSDSSIPNDLVNVRGTSAATLIEGNGGIDIFSVSSDAPVNAGSLSTIQGPLTLNGDAGLNIATLSNVGGPAGAGALTATQFTGFGTAGITFAELSALGIDLSDDPVNGDTLNVDSTKAQGATNVRTNGGPDVVNVRAESGFTSISTGGGDDVVNVFDGAETLNGITGPLSIDAGGGAANRLIVSDLGGGAHPHVVVTGGQITGLAPAAITYAATGGGFTDGAAGDGILLRGADAAADVFTVTGVAAGNTLKVEGHGGADRLITPGPAGARTWFVLGPDSGRVSGHITFTGTESLTGGPGRDVFRFLAGGALHGVVDGGGGGDWLDYSARAGSVVVNLAAGKASLTGGVVHVQHVTGSSRGGDRLTGDGQGNVLVGHGQGNVLVGGGGRDVLVGGFGVNTLVGGAADDLEVAGRTSYDHSPDALDAIFAEWSSAGTYRRRIADLRSGGGLAAGRKLVVGATAFVFPGGLGDGALLGDGGLDWFITHFPGAVLDRQPGEVVTTAG